MTGDRTKRAVTTKFLLAVDKGKRTVTSVAVAGTFTSWIAIPLYFANGCWEARLGVDPGTHQYKFIVDGLWIHDDDKHNVANDQGTRNNTLVIFPGASVAEVPSSVLKHVKSGKVFRDSQRREILKAVSRLSEREPAIDEDAARAKKEAEELEAARIEAERTRDQEAIARDIKEGLLKNAVKREILTPLKEQVEHPVYDILDDTVFNPNVDAFVPKHLQTRDESVNWGVKKFSEIREKKESCSEDDINWKVGDECVAKWRGRYWYNGQILKIIHDQVLVKYLDCGDEDYANLEELKPAGSLTEIGTLKDADNEGGSVKNSSAGVAVKLGKPSSRSSEGKKPTLVPGRCAE